LFKHQNETIMNSKATTALRIFSVYLCFSLT